MPGILSDQFTLSSMLRGLGLEGGAEDILGSFKVRDPGQYSEGLQRLLGVAGEQVGGLGEEYSGLLENLQSEYETARGGLAGTFQTAIGGLAARHQQEMGGLRTGFETGIGELRTGRATGMRGLREAWMEQAREDQGDWQLGGRKRRLKRARRAAGVEQREMQTAFETRRKGLLAGYETARVGEQTAFGVERERLRTGYGAQREALRTGYESDIFGAEQWMGGQYRDLLSSLESGITGYIRDIASRGAEFGEGDDPSKYTTPEDRASNLYGRLGGPSDPYDWNFDAYINRGGTANYSTWVSYGRPLDPKDEKPSDERFLPGGGEEGGFMLGNEGAGGYPHPFR